MEWGGGTYISAVLVDKVALIPNMKNYNPHTRVSHLRKGKSRRAEFRGHVIQRVIFFIRVRVWGGDPKTSWCKTAVQL